MTADDNPARRAGASRPVTGVPGTPDADDLRPWYDSCDWQSDPALAYLRGLQDGTELGRQEAERNIAATITAALARALGGPDCTDLHLAVHSHLRAVDARRARAGADRPGPRPGDYPGLRRAG